MSFLRKMYAQVRLDTDAPAALGEANIVRAGCRITTVASTYILTDNPGGLKESLFCYAVDASGDKIADSEFQINAGSLGQGVTYSTGDSAFKINFSNNPPIGTPDSSWARIVCNPAQTTSFVNFYQTDTAADTPLAETIDLPTTGKIEGYVGVRDVDIVVDFAGVRTHIFDVSVEKREYVTPEDFGAVGDGTTDDARNIQNALDYLSYIAGGGELRLGNKTYLCKIATTQAVISGLTISGDNVKVVGQGHGSIIKQGYDVAAGSVFNTFIVAEGVDGASFQDFTIDDTGVSTAGDLPVTTKAAIYAGGNSSQTSRLRITGMWIRARNKNAIYLIGCDGFTIINNTLGNNGGQMGGHGIYIVDGTSTTSKRGIISACQLYDDNSVNGRAGVYILQVDRIIVSDCSIRGWTYGVRFGGGSDLSIDSCHIREQGTHGIYTNASTTVERLSINGNTINATGSGNNGNGIVIDMDGANCLGGVIIGNLISSTGGSAIVLDNFLYGNVSNNTISDFNTDDDVVAGATERLNYQAGIGVDVTAVGSLFGGNQIRDTSSGSSYGFVFSSGIAGITVYGNALTGSSFTSEFYMETSSDVTNCVWLNPDTAGTVPTYSWAWGDPDLTSGLLKSDGSVTAPGGIDTDGGDVTLGTGDLNTEGGNVEIGDGQLINATGTKGWVNLGDHWDDVGVGGLTVVTVPAGNAPTFVANAWTSGAGSTGVGAYSFSATVEEEVFFELQLPHGYKEGTDVYPHVHWAPNSTNTGNVIWGLEYTVANVNGTFGNTASLEVTDAADGTAYKHQATSFTAITGTTFVASTVFICRLYRKAADAADTFTGEALLASIDFHIQKNSIGSDAEFTKA